MLLQVKLGIKCPAPRIGHNISFNDTVTLHIFERSHITEFIFGWQGSVTDALHFTVPLFTRMDFSTTLSSVIVS